MVWIDLEMRAGSVILTVTFKWFGLFVYKGCCDAVLSQGRENREVPQIWGKGKWSGRWGWLLWPQHLPGNQVCVRPAPDEQTELWPPRGGGVGPVSPELALRAPGSLRMYHNGTVMPTSGQRFCGRQCQVGPGSP